MKRAAETAAQIATGSSRAPAVPTSGRPASIRRVPRLHRRRPAQRNARCSKRSGQSRACLRSARLAREASFNEELREILVATSDGRMARGRQRSFASAFASSRKTAASDKRGRAAAAVEHDGVLRRALTRVARTKAAAGAGRSACSTRGVRPRGHARGARARRQRHLLHRGAGARPRGGLQPQRERATTADRWQGRGL